MKSVRHFFSRRPWIAAICALVLAGCGHFGKNDPATAMNEFFTLLAKQHFQQAYLSASVPFQQMLSEAAFEAIARDYGMGNFISCKWAPPTVEGKEARLQGELQLKDDRTLFFRVTLVKDSGRWKLYSMETPSPQDPSKIVDIFGRFKHGIGFNEVFTRQIPNDDEIRKLVTETMLKFNACLHGKNFQSFYDYTSVLWQSRTTEEQVARAFKPYTDANATLDFIKDVKMIFEEPPRLSADGYLIVNGYYPTFPRVIFRLQYVFELPRWKMNGITLSLEQ